jgi:spermidine synthase
LKGFGFEKFDSSSGTLLDREKASLSKMEVRADHRLKWIVGGDGLLHSIMSVDDPCYPLMPYVRSMLTVLLINQHAGNALSLGLGSGSIERYCQHKFPAIKLTSVEISEAIVKLVRQHFPLPADLQVVIDDAHHFLENNIAPKDIIFCDIFDLKDRNNYIYNKRFIELLFNNLTKDGVVAINYIYKDQEDLVNLLVEVRKLFSCTAILEIERQSNIVVIASRVYRSTEEIRLATSGFSDRPNDIDWADIISGIKWLPEPESSTH